MIRVSEDYLWRLRWLGGNSGVWVNWVILKFDVDRSSVWKGEDVRGEDV
jgi:uncharacterized membrane protein YsdA (DUF1294 family)